MSEYLTEQEQIQQLKTWVKQYGFPIIAGLIAATLISVGWNYWQNYRNNIRLEASVVYDEMLGMRAQNNSDGAIVHAKKIMKDYYNTPYADMAAFLLAREAINKKDYPEAINQLNWVMSHSKNNSIRQLARIRVARVLIAEKKPDAALNFLNTIDDENFAALIDETKGDAYLALNRISSAREAYQLALKETPNADTVRPILKMKLDNTQ